MQTPYVRLRSGDAGRSWRRLQFSACPQESRPNPNTLTHPHRWIQPQGSGRLLKLVLIMVRHSPPQSQDWISPSSDSTPFHSSENSSAGSATMAMGSKWHKTRALHVANQAPACLASPCRLGNSQGRPMSSFLEQTVKLRPPMPGLLVSMSSIPRRAAEGPISSLYTVSEELVDTLDAR